MRIAKLIDRHERYTVPDADTDHVNPSHQTRSLPARSCAEPLHRPSDLSRRRDSTVDPALSGDFNISTTPQMVAIRFHGRSAASTSAAQLPPREPGTRRPGRTPPVGPPGSGHHG